MPKHKGGIGDAPIDKNVRATMNALAAGIDVVLNGEGCAANAKKNGFVLLVFPFGGAAGRANYISNANRDDIVVLLKEHLARFEGQPEIRGRA